MRPPLKSHMAGAPHHGVILFGSIAEVISFARMTMSLLISILALTVSITTAWLTLLRRGRLRMTRPAFVGYVWDKPGGEPKIFLRTMLYATGKRGYVIESLYLKVLCNGVEHTFSFWTVRQNDRMTIGSGMRVGKDGVSADFHFLPPKDAHNFQFLTGEYDIALYARSVSSSSPILLSKFRLSLSDEQANAIRPNMMNGVFYNWQPELQCYHSHIDSPPTL